MNFRHIPLEGDSDCAVRLNVQMCNASWTYAEVVEEVHDLSKNLEISFVHVKEKRELSCKFLRLRKELGVQVS